MRYRPSITLVVCAVLLVTLSGCSGIRPYQSTLEPNLTIHTRTASGSVFTSVKARVDIYAVNDACQLSYRGSVNLDRPEVQIGLPASGAVTLDFIFSSSTFFAGTQGSTGFDRYLKTRPGYAYLAEAHYQEGIYDVILKEQKDGSGKQRELDFAECVPGS